MMQKKPLISIIITCKNAYQWLEKCFSSLANQTVQNFEIVFVDDGSTDQSLDFVEKHYPDTVIVQNIENVGFARANNAGATVAKGDYLFILNADTYLDDDTIEKLTNTIKKHSKYHYMQLDIRKYNKSNMKGEACTFNMDRFGYPIWSGKEENPFYADGAAMVIKKDLFFKLGGFDEKYFIYLEDLDIAWRARMLGEEVYYLKGIHVYHYAGGTSVNTQIKEGSYQTSLRRRYDAQKNNLRTLVKNYELKNLFWALPVSLILASIEGWLYLFKGNIIGFLYLHKAIWWNILNLSDTLNQRKKIQCIRTVDDTVILKRSDKRISKIHSFFLHGVPSMKLN